MGIFKWVYFLYTHFLGKYNFNYTKNGIWLILKYTFTNAHVLPDGHMNIQTTGYDNEGV